ncbi:MAG: toll/interleukin-1 receptor domain-containing protein [Planctomycetaceae bacterium]
MSNSVLLCLKDFALQYDVFICHCSIDKEGVVDPLVAACTESGIRCWIDSREIQWGDSIPERISEGLQKSRFVLVVISQNTITRRWQPKEISAALNAENSHGAVRVLPLYVGDRTMLEQQLPLLADKH